MVMKKKKHKWRDLLPRSDYPFPTYYCLKCGRFANNFPGNQYLFIEECEKKELVMS